MSEFHFDVDEIDFFTIPDLLRQGIKIPQLADAIEREGVQGWDRYGRFKVFSSQDKEYQTALDFLAAQHKWEAYEAMTQYETESPLEMCDWDSDVYLTGWRRDQLPNFGRLAAHRESDPPDPSRKRPSDTKRKNADLMLIGALLAFIKGEDGFERHPQFKSQTDLIGYLLDKYRDMNGIDKRTIETKFSLANKMIHTTS